MAENRDDSRSSVPEVEPPEDESEESADRSTGRTTAELRLLRASYQFSGPLPPPEILKGYDETFEGCAERIVAMAEAQSQHRQSLEKMVVTSNCSNERRGQWFAFILALVVIAGGVFLLGQGKSIQGFGAIILAVASLAGTLIYNRHEQGKERAQKSESLPQFRDRPAHSD